MLVLLILLQTFLWTKAAQIPCKIITDTRNGRWCNMDGKTSIDEYEATISDPRDETVTGITFDYNRRITFLPIDVHMKMPKLVYFYARNCSVSQISKANFNRMSFLEYLLLDANQIEMIKGETFEDLVNIHWISLINNRIKFINAKLFEDKPSLSYVDLRDNICITDRFDILRIPYLKRTISKKCGFNEAGLLSNVQCGTVSFAGGLVVGGTSTVRGQWPFLAALTLSSNGAFFCGGNLISTKHVLTAAHCLHPKDVTKQWKPEEVTVLVGRQNIRLATENNAYKRIVKEIFMHPNWSNDTPKYDADLAILLMRAVEFSSFIQPVCLTNHADMSKQLDGTVVGWGKAESEAAHEIVPRQVSIHAVTDAVCFAEDHDLGNIFSPRTFCAGGEGAGPCTGDSGGGFYVRFNGYWALKGIVSAGAFNNVGACDVGRYTLFTRLSHFSNWIQEIVEQGSSISELSRPLQSTTQLPSQLPLADFECGVPEFTIDISRSTGTGLVLGGSNAKRGEIPWLAAYYENSRNDSGFVCAGSLISTKLVVTGASCILRKGTSLPRSSEDATIFLGKQNLETLHETYSLVSGVSQILLHPDWKTDDQHYDADIALMVLMRTVQFNKFIKPICLWTSTNSYADLIGKSGIIVGWGVTEQSEPSLDKPKWTKINVVSEATCLRSNQAFRDLTSDRTFCGGNTNNISGPCNGDSGAGFLTYAYNIWYLRGIVSASLYDSVHQICDTKNYAVYTDVQQFLSWLKGNIRRHG